MKLNSLPIAVGYWVIVDGDYKTHYPLAHRPHWWYRLWARALLGIRWVERNVPSQRTSE